jgi:hypothetical protein
MSPVSLHLQNDVETNIYFIEPFSGVSFPLFLCCKTMDGSTLFNLRSNTSLSSIFHFISYPEQYTTNPFFRDALFISNLGWMKSFIMSIKSQVGLSLFKEIANSVLIDLSIKMNDKKSIIQLNFSKHSTVLNKNVHYNIYFDLSFNFIDVEFLSYAYIDNSQVEQLSKFSSSNKLMAFYVLLHYYTNIDMHNNLVSMLNVENDLNDDNLSICNSIVSMNEI